MSTEGRLIIIFSLLAALLGGSVPLWRGESCWRIFFGALITGVVTFVVLTLLAS